MAAYKIHDEETSLANEPDYYLKYTAAEYINWTYEGRYELIHGKAHRMLSPGTIHQEVSRELVRFFFQNLDGESCEFFFGPLDVYLLHDGEDWAEARSIVKPDIFVVSDRAKLVDKGCIGTPELVVEIVTPFSVTKDVGDKFSLYEEYSVKEYWIVHPEDQTVAVNVLENGKYKTLHLLTKGQTLQSVTFPFLTVDLAQVFPETEIED